MGIERSTFSAITIDGKTYVHDVVIRLSSEVMKRKKKLSKKYSGTSHVLSKKEAKFVFEKGCEQLVVGSGQMGNVRLWSEAEAYFAKRGHTLGHDSPDRSQWIKCGPEIESEHTTLSPNARGRKRLLPTK